MAESNAPTRSLTRTSDGANETRALSRHAFGELQGAIGGIGALHRAVADRVFRYVGPGARPAQLAHDGISRFVYSGVRGGAGLIGRAADVALAHGGPREDRPISTTPGGAAALAVLTGLTGDALERQGSALHEPISVRVRRRALEVTPDALANAFPHATPRLVVFVHGLMSTELVWEWGSRGTGGSYGSRLAEDAGCTPVFVRYNTGRHVSENGRSLAELLDELTAAWPVEVERIALVGHSMGGLVSRSACHQADDGAMPWVRRVRHVVSLGTPHLGAPLEQSAHWASAALSALPETRPLGSFLRRRSAGIRDLRHGSLVDEDWKGRDPDALRAVACREVPLLDGATHCFVAATVTRSPRHPVGRLVGDCLVLEASASGRGSSRRIPFEEEHGMHLGGAHHMTLLNHPRVYERLRDWLTAPRRALGA